MDFYSAMVNHHKLASEVKGDDEQAAQERDGHLSLAGFYSQLTIAEALYMFARYYLPEMYEDDISESEPEDLIAAPLFDIDDDEIKDIIKELREGNPAHIMASEVIFRAWSHLKEEPE